MVSVNWGLMRKKIEPIPDFLELIKKNFTDAEFNMLNEVDPENQVECFYKLWTAKESLLKAIGSGFSIAPDTFSVVSDGRISKTVSLMDKNWFLQALPDVMNCKITLCSDSPAGVEIEELNADSFNKTIKKLR